MRHYDPVNIHTGRYGSVSARHSHITARVDNHNWVKMYRDIFLESNEREHSLGLSNVVVKSFAYPSSHIHLCEHAGMCLSRPASGPLLSGVVSTGCEVAPLRYVPVMVSLPAMTCCPFKVPDWKRLLHTLVLHQLTKILDNVL